jgi:hypothetical protein
VFLPGGIRHRSKANQRPEGRLPFPHDVCLTMRGKENHTNSMTSIHKIFPLQVFSTQRHDTAFHDIIQ